jgi:hypothetical protein
LKAHVASPTSSLGLSSATLHVAMAETRRPASDTALSLSLPLHSPQPTVLNLIPVGLREASLDSPTFRCTALHFAENIDAVERWLDGYVKAAARLVAEVSSLEAAVNSFLSHSMPPAPLSEAVLDHDYTLLAMRRYGEGAREFWGNTLRSVKRYDPAVIEPIRAFLNQELRIFKDSRRAMDNAQKAFDGVLSRYSAQSKGKEASSLREEAFQLHEARKLYLKASMDFCVQAPQLRASLDKVSDAIDTCPVLCEGTRVLPAKTLALSQRPRGTFKSNAFCSSSSESLPINGKRCGKLENLVLPRLQSGEMKWSASVVGAEKWRTRNERSNVSFSRHGG